MQKIAIIRLSALGDIIHTIPAVHLIKQYLSNVEITWFVENGNSQLLEVFEPFVKIEKVNLKNKNIKEIFFEARRIRRKFKDEFDLIIDYQGLIKSAVLSLILGKRRYGFNKKNLREILASVFYNKKAEFFTESRHIIEKNISLTRYVLEAQYDIKNFRGEVKRPNILQFDTQKTDKFLKDNHIEDGNFIILNIGGGWETKTLGIEQYEEIVYLLKPNYKVLILWGNENEKIIAEKLSKNTKTVSIPFLNFMDLFYIIGKAEFLISSDTLALHIADMVNTKSIGIFGPTSPKRNGSLNKESVYIYKNLSCSPCHKKKCDNPICIESINILDFKKALRKFKKV